MEIQGPDLTKQPPRSPRVRLGGYVILPRMLDKGRASILGKAGEYHFNCPMDQRFLTFAGVDAGAVLEELKHRRGDREILQWIGANAKHRRMDSEIACWSRFQEERVPADPETREFFNKLHKATAAEREDIANWFDLLDLDDYVSFGGNA